VVLPKKRKPLPWLRWLLLLPIPLLWCVASHFGWLGFLEDKLTDWRFRFRGERAAPVKVLYVDIDSQSLAEIGGFPWSRKFFARTTSALIEHGHVKAIGIDIVFSENGVAESVDWKKRVQGNLEFARYLSKTPPVVLAASYAAAIDRDITGELVFRELPRVKLLVTDAKPPSPETPVFRISEADPRRTWGPALIGLIDTLGGATRTVPLFAPSDVRTFPHLSLELVRLHDGVAPDGVKIGADHIDLVKPDGTLARRVPLQEGQLLDVNWFSKWQSPAHNPRIGFSTVFNYAEMLSSEKPEEKAAAQAFFAQSEFRDAIVLIGPVDPLLQDLAMTPFDDVPVPKVGVHGNVVKTIMSGEYLRRLPAWGGVRWLDFAVVLGLTLSVSALATRGGARGLATKAGALLLLGGYGAAAFLVFKSHHLVLPLTAPLGAAFTTSFAGVIWQLIDEQKQKGRIKGMFGAYVSPQLVDRMIDSGEDPQLGGHDAEITAFFSDIQAFSTFSEKLGSGPLVELMNEYLTACTDIVQEEGGTLDKYIGDAVVAMFGAPIALPDHAYRACIASQRMQKRLGELREKWRSEGAKWPEVVWRMQSRIGLNTGVCMIGNMGSRTRFNYTMMGDNVNLGARMESGAKSWGVYSMCTEATRAACEQHGGDHVVFRPLGRIVVKGRTQAVPIHEIIGLKEDVTSHTRECLGLFEQGLARYRARDWDAALALFAKSRELEPNGLSRIPGAINPSLVYLDLAQHCKQEPPPQDWDGVFVMSEK
jgi:adenylate cyclase